MLIFQKILGRWQRNVRSMPWQSKFWDPRISALNKNPEDYGDSEHSHRATGFFHPKKNENSVRMDGTNIDSNGHDMVGTLM